MQDNAEHDISNCIHLIDILYVFFPPNPWEQDVLIPVVNIISIPEAKSAWQSPTFGGRIILHFSKPYINPLTFCLTQPGTSNHQTSHNPSIHQTEISWVFSGHLDLWLPFHCSHHRAGGYYWYSIWKQLRGEGMVSLSRCQLHFGYLQADQSNLCILFGEPIIYWFWHYTPHDCFNYVSMFLQESWWIRCRFRSCIHLKAPSLKQDQTNGPVLM